VECSGRDSCRAELSVLGVSFQVVDHDVLCLLCNRPIWDALGHVVQDLGGPYHVCHSLHVGDATVAWPIFCTRLS